MASGCANCEKLERRLARYRNAFADIFRHVDSAVADLRRKIRHHEAWLRQAGKEDTAEDTDE